MSRHHAHAANHPRAKVELFTFCGPERRPDVGEYGQWWDDARAEWRWFLPTWVCGRAVSVSVERPLRRIIVVGWVRVETRNGWRARIELKPGQQEATGST